MVDDNIWTVPQAAVWIRTRELSAVRGLEGQARHLLSEAEAVVPGATDAAWLPLRLALLADHVRSWAKVESDDEWEQIPANFWEGANFTDAVEAVTASGPLRIADRQWRRARLRDICLEADDCCGHWLTPTEVLGSGPLSISLARRALPAGDEEWFPWFLTHPAVLVTGLNRDGERVPIDHGTIMTRGEIDHATDSLATADGRVSLSAITAELRLAVAVAVRENTLTAMVHAQTGPRVPPRTEEAPSEADLLSTLTLEMVNRKNVTKDPRDRESMRIWMKDELGLSRKDADALYYQMPKPLRAAPMGRPPGKSGQKSKTAARL